eukprot:TRINITY_DN1834_c0_g1_i3.p2 TRINITY_DN1834_c0_g1~~TRINITY_DN1834_c0_g1_i3.p2  ORF type:complete len:396 (-),score=139.12 TRINITY_DN1834_c0_g1_i3:2143-3330(-)
MPSFQLSAKLCLYLFSGLLCASLAAALSAGSGAVLWQDASRLAADASNLRTDSTSGSVRVKAWPSSAPADDGDRFTCGAVTGTYHSGANFEDGSAACISLDAHLSFVRLAVSRPMCTHNYDKFSVRWTGYLLGPATGPVTLRMTVSDAGRLFVDGQLAAEAHDHKGFSAISATMDMVAGAYYPIVFEFRQDSTGMGVGADLEWSYEGQQQLTAIPSGNLCIDRRQAAQPAPELQPAMTRSPHNGLSMVSFDGHTFMSYPPQAFDFDAGSSIIAVFRFNGQDETKSTSLFEFWGPDANRITIQRRSTGKAHSTGYYRLPHQSFDSSSEFSSDELAVWAFVHSADEQRMSVYKNNQHTCAFVCLCLRPDAFVCMLACCAVVCLGLRPDGVFARAPIG